MGQDAEKVFDSPSCPLLIHDSGRTSRRILEARAGAWVSQGEFGDLLRREPVQVVVLVGGGVRWFTSPSRYHEGRYRQTRVAELDVDRHWLINDDPKFLTALASNCLFGGLANFDVTADHVPTIGVPPALREAMTQKHTTVAHQNCRGDVGLHAPVSQSIRTHRESEATC